MKICSLILIILTILIPSTFAISKQPAVSDATRHYLLGETALKRGDKLTAVTEWEAVIKLKPDSSHTLSVLNDLKTSLSTLENDTLKAYRQGIELMASNKLDESEKTLAAALRSLPDCQCIQDGLCSLTALQQKARKEKEPKSSISIVIVGDKPQQADFTTSNLHFTAPKKEHRSSVVNLANEYEQCAAGTITNCTKLYYDAIRVEVQVIDRRSNQLVKTQHAETVGIGAGESRSFLCIDPVWVPTGTKPETIYTLKVTSTIPGRTDPVRKVNPGNR